MKNIILNEYSNYKLCGVPETIFMDDSIKSFKESPDHEECYQPTRKEF